MKRKLLALLLAVMLVIPCVAAVAVSAAENTVTYNFNRLTYAGSYGTTYSVDGDGNLSLTYASLYQEVKYKLPEEISMAECTSVTFTGLTSDAIAFKVYDSAGNQIEVLYNCRGTSEKEFVITPSSGKTAAAIGIMNNTDKSGVTAKISSVKFTLENAQDNSQSTIDMSGATLLNTYGSVYGYSGTCVSLSQLKDADTLAFVKKHYNSITLENEMKPDFVLKRWSKQLISVSEAKKLGYYIPDSYTETVVPKLNFDDIDAALKICADNGLRMRAHTLVWHSQTPAYFFREGYNESGAYVDTATMDARLEFYVKTVMNHVYLSGYGDVVYAWDICNEYLNAKTASSSDWVKVYGEQGNTPDFVKRAFRYANETLEYFGRRNSVSLFYNDYNTYINSSAVVELINYINSDNKLCDGIGMQAHLDVSYPGVSLFVNTVQKFVDAGIEVQITELDVTNSSASAQASYLYDIMSGVNNIKKNGGNITGITYWGLYDSVSWRASGAPLLFTALDTPKAAYTKVLEAYFNAGYVIDNKAEASVQGGTTTETEEGSVQSGTSSETEDDSVQSGTTTETVPENGVAEDNEQEENVSGEATKVTVIHNFSKSGKTSDFFTISGNLSTSKGTVTYNGLTLKKCLKLETATSIKFTTERASELVLVFNSANSKNIKIDGKKYTFTDGIFKIELTAGAHEIKKANTANLFYMEVTY